jgi:hypothetical protein
VLYDQEEGYTLLVHWKRFPEKQSFVLAFPFSRENFRLRCITLHPSLPVNQPSIIKEAPKSERAEKQLMWKTLALIHS